MAALDRSVPRLHQTIEMMGLMEGPKETEMMNRILKPIIFGPMKDKKPWEILKPRNLPVLAGCC